MFKRKTVFILGAGASWHYGYPTGEELVRKVIEKAMLANELFAGNRINDMPAFIHARCRNPSDPMSVEVAYSQALSECRRLAEKLRQINPTVIDFFLGHYPSLSEVGRFITAWVLMECEWKFESTGRVNKNRTEKDLSLNGTHRDDWYQFILHRMLFDISEFKDIRKNNVHFVTFNYDTSLDRRLLESLESIESIENQHAREFMEGRVSHVYGTLGNKEVFNFHTLRSDANFGNPAAAGAYRTAKAALDEAYRASELIRVINDEKDLDETAIVTAQQLLTDAEVVYILGYGFDPLNCERLDLRRTLRSQPNAPSKIILLTNYNDSNRVNMEVGRVIFNNPRAVLSGTSPIPGQPTQEIYLEKSTRDVYGAFAYDFDAPEQL